MRLSRRFAPFLLCLPSAIAFQPISPSTRPGSSRLLELRLQSKSPEPTMSLSEDAKQQPDFLYKTGIPTLRSSAHRVKFSPKHRTCLDQSALKKMPKHILDEYQLVDYRLQEHDFCRTLVDFLHTTCDPNIVGHFDTSTRSRSHDNTKEFRLEDLRVPPLSLTRQVQGGVCEDAQAYLSDQLASHEPFLKLFDEFVVTVILPHLKQSMGLVVGDDEETSFYVQRPPTLRLQPGPAKAYVKQHCDATYGHQMGEVNCWIPLTDRALAKGVNLHLVLNDGEDTTIPANLGQAIVFHGTSQPHYVPANHSVYTRVSMDFRIGIEGYYDRDWAMQGTTSDHSRREYRL